MIKLDYSRIAHNIDNIPDSEKVIDHFSDLSSQAHVLDREDDLPDGVEADKVLRYLILMFSPNTPVRDAYPDINQRKKYCLLKLNLLSGDDAASDGYSQMCMMNEEWIIERFITFTRLFCSEDYTIMATAEARIEAMQRSLMTLDSSKSQDDKNYQEGLERWRKTLVDARNRIMNDESSIVLQRSITFSVRSESLGLEPESWSRVWREKKDIFTEVIP